MSAKAQAAEGARRGGEGRSAGARRKRYCRRCKSRVSRSARRCVYCRRLLSPAALALKAFAAVAFLLLLGRFLGLF